MPDASLLPAIKMALRVHEIGNQSPYKLAFAGKGKSGASFGFMQGDLAAGQPIVVETFRKVLAAAGFTKTRIDKLVAALSVHLLANPLSAADTAAVNAALQAQSALVDAMDDQLLQNVLDDLDLCTAAAQKAKRTIDSTALLYAALWINMSGKPTTLLTWLAGGDPELGVPVAQPGNPVTSASMRAYVLATPYYRANPANVAHLDDAVAAGAALLPSKRTAAAKAAMLAPAAVTGDHLVYEQATGRLLVIEGATTDTIGVGYSGSRSAGAVNDPSQQCNKGIGPIPRGTYTIGPPGPGPSPYSLRLTPSPQNDMCGRNGFLIHGDSTAHPGDASDGCIILNRPERERIVATGLKTLVVVDHVSV